MGDLSAHFDSSEFRCKHCHTNVVDYRLIQSLEKLRRLAAEPIYITSGYRCKTHNARVGGSSNSQHLYGRAADIRIGAYSVFDMYNLALCVPEFQDGGIGIYPQDRFIHVDIRPYVARWARLNRTYVSLEEGLKYLGHG